MAAQDCPTAADAELLIRWQAMHSGLRRLTDVLFEDVQAEVGLPPSALEVLCFLIASPGQAVPMKEISRLLGFSTAGTTGVVDRLADAGLVERRPSPTDRRVIFAALTEQGMRAAASVATAFAAAVRHRVAQPLTDDGFAGFEAALGTLGLIGDGALPDCPAAAAR